MSKRDKYLIGKLVEEQKQRCIECGGSLWDSVCDAHGDNNWLEGLLKKSLKVCSVCSIVHTQKGKVFFIKGRKVYFDGRFFFLNQKNGYEEIEYYDE